MLHVVRFNFDTSVSHGLGACIIREANCMQQFACNLLLDTATGRHGQGDVECPADNQSLDIANRVPKQHCATIMPVSIWPRSRPSYTTARPPRRAAARPIPTAQSLAAAQSPAPDMLLAIAAVHIGSFLAMLQVCRGWRAALKAQEEWLWERLVLHHFPRVEAILRLSSASATVSSYRQLYRKQLRTDYRMKQQRPKRIGPSSFDQMLFSIELSKRPTQFPGDVEPCGDVPLLASWTGRISDSQALSKEACRMWEGQQVPDRLISQFSILSPELHNLNLRIYVTWKMDSMKIYDGNCEGAAGGEGNQGFRWMFELEGGRQPIVNLLAPLVPYVMPEIDTTTGAVSLGFQWNWSDTWVDRMMIEATPVDAFIPMNASDLDDWKGALDWAQGEEME